MAQAPGRLGRGRRDDLRHHDRQGRRRDPLARQRPPGADPGRAGRDGRGRDTPGGDRRRGQARRGTPRGGGRGRGRTDGPAEPAEADAGQAPAAAPRSDDPDRSRFYSPVVRRIADEHGIDLTPCQGTGIGGRVRKTDLCLHRERRRGAAEQMAPAERPLHTESPYRPEPESAAAPEPRAAAQPAIARRTPRADVADAAAIAEHMVREPAHRGALHDDRRGRHVAAWSPRARELKRGDGGAAASRSPTSPSSRRRPSTALRASTRC